MAELDSQLTVMKTLKAHLKECFKDLVLDPNSATLRTKFRAGWPPNEKKLVYPTVSIDILGNGDYEQRRATFLRYLGTSAPTDPDARALVSTGTIRLPVSIDIFAKSRTQRSVVVGALEKCFSPNPLEDGGTLRLTLTNFFDASVKFNRVGTPYYQDSSDRVGKDEWRATVGVSAELEQLFDVPVTKLLKLGINWTTIQSSDERSARTEVLTIFEPPTP